MVHDTDKNKQFKQIPEVKDFPSGRKVRFEPNTESLDRKNKMQDMEEKCHDYDKGLVLAKEHFDVTERLSKHLLKGERGNNTKCDLFDALKAICYLFMFVTVIFLAFKQLQHEVRGPFELDDAVLEEKLVPLQTLLEDIKHDLSTRKQPTPDLDMEKYKEDALSKLPDTFMEKPSKERQNVIHLLQRVTEGVLELKDDALPEEKLGPLLGLLDGIKHDVSLLSLAEQPILDFKGCNRLCINHH